MIQRTLESRLRLIAPCMLLALFSLSAIPDSACTYLGEVYSGKTDVGKMGGHLNVDVATQPGCDIPQEIPEPWVTVKVLPNGPKKSILSSQAQGDVMVHYLVSILPNKTSSPRNQRIRFGDCSFTISQADTLNP